MMEMCSGNRFELIEKYKRKLINSTNIETSPDEMEVLDSILFRCWQMGWLDSLEKQTAKKPKEIIKRQVYNPEKAFEDIRLMVGGWINETLYDKDSTIDEVKVALAYLVSMIETYDTIRKWGNNDGN